MKIVEEHVPDIISVDFRDRRVLDRHYLDPEDTSPLRNVSDDVRSAIFLQLAEEFTQFHRELNGYRRSTEFVMAVQDNEHRSPDELFDLLEQGRSVWRSNPQFYHALSILLRRAANAVPITRPSSPAGS